MPSNSEKRAEQQRRRRSLNRAMSTEPKNKGGRPRTHLDDCACSRCRARRAPPMDTDGVPDPDDLVLPPTKSHKITRRYESPPPPIATYHDQFDELYITQVPVFLEATAQQRAWANPWPSSGEGIVKVVPLR